MFCLVGLVPQKEGEMKVEEEKEKETDHPVSSIKLSKCEFCEGFFSASKITDHKRTCLKSPKSIRTIKLRRPQKQTSKNGQLLDSPPVSAPPECVSVGEPGAFCEITVRDQTVAGDHDYFKIPASSETETGVQLKTSVSF